MKYENAKRIGEELLTQQMVGGEEDEYEEFLCVAIEALEKQIPNMVITRKVGVIYEYSCCKCKYELNSGDKYCWNCGQAIDWSEK